MQEPFATIDIGSNTTLLLIMAKEGETFTVLSDEIYFTRLAEGVWQNGEFSEAALMRLEKAFQSIKKHLQAFKVERVQAVATSASRQARNKDKLFEMAKKLRHILCRDYHSPKRSRVDFYRLPFRSGP